MESQDEQMGELTRIAFRSAPEVAAQKIRSAIITGQLKPGERLIEQKLAAKLGIGQPTLREALKEIEYQGLVRKVPQRGTYVTKLDKEDYRKILEVRVVLEALAVALAAKNISPEGESELVTLINEMGSATAESDLARFHEADVSFHRKIWTLAGNEYLTKALERTTFRLFAFASLDLRREVMRQRQTALRQHEGILAGLRSHDPVEASRAFITHTVCYWNALYQVGLTVDELVEISSISTLGLPQAPI